MDLKIKLSQRISKNDIYEIIHLTQGDTAREQELYSLLFDANDRVSYNAAWILTHFSERENEWLYSKQTQLIDQVLTCNYIGKRRLILAIIYKQPLANPPRVDFLDFCLKRMISKAEPYGTRALCMKLAYELCRSIPQLKQELLITLEMIEGELSPAIQVTKKHILKAIKKKEFINNMIYCNSYLLPKNCQNE